MSYDIVRYGISNRVEGLGFAKSESIVDYENAPGGEFGNTFILKMPESISDSENSTLNGRVHDVQSWHLLIAFDRTSMSDLINYDEMMRARESIIQDLDNADNTTFVRQLRYRESNVEDFPNYFLLTIILEVTDVITY